MSSNCLRLDSDKTQFVWPGSRVEISKLIFFPSPILFTLCRCKRFEQYMFDHEPTIYYNYQSCKRCLPILLLLSLSNSTTIVYPRYIVSVTGIALQCILVN